MAGILKVDGQSAARPFLVPVQALVFVVFSLATALSGLSGHTEPAAKSQKTKPARLTVSGYGLLGSYELKHNLRTLELSGKEPEFFNSDFVEDAALILTGRLKRDGYLQSSITAQLTLITGGRIQVEAQDLIENPLPHSLRFKAVHFQIHKGVLYYFNSLQFETLAAISEKQARSYFVGTETLFHSKHARVYTPERLRRGISSLSDALDRLGYGEAKVETAQPRRNDETGAVDAHIRIEQGPKLVVNSVREEFYYQGAIEPSETHTVFLNRPYSKLWLQDFVLGLKTNQFHRGYPDTSVEVQTLRRSPTGQQVGLALQATVKTGALVRIGNIEFEGEKRTKVSLMTRRVRIRRGELLDVTKVEEGRYRLAEPGTFDTTTLKYKDVDEHTRDVIYQVHEGKQLNLSLLVGWGSYELLRGGFEAEMFNIFGLAHRADLKAVQSFKSSSGEFTYTIPELIGNDVDLFFNASGLRREEPSFLRVEYGGGVGVHKYFKPEATDVSLRYSYQILSALDTTVAEVASEGLTNPAVGSVILDLKHDRRDNPLYPHSGYKIFATVETASEYFGGQGNYERIEASASWHHSLGGGRLLSLGASQGIAYSFGSPAQNLPFTKRFFPGGPDSIRGYQEDDASPRNAQGQLVGAETYTLGTVELEQALTPKWAVVAFSDSLGFAHRVANYPFDTGLFSIGGGIRWHTVIGPMRLEYGYNLNPRPRDPSGTLQFSLGFPF